MLKDIKTLITNLLNSSQINNQIETIKEKLAQEDISDNEKVVFLEKSFRKAIKSNRLRIGLAFLDLILEIDPENIENLKRKAELLESELWQGNDSLEAYRKLAQLQPEDEELSEKVEELELEAGNYDKLLSKFTTEAEEAEEKELASHMYYKAAEVSAKYAEDKEQTELLLMQSLEQDETNGDALKHLCRIYRENQRYEDFVNLVQPKLDLFEDPENRQLLTLETAEYMLEYLQNPQEAEALIKKVREEDPDNPKSKTLLVSAYNQQDKTEDLIEFYENEIQTSRRPDPGIYLQLGMIWWRQLEDLEKAEQYFRKLRKTEPDSPLLLNFYEAYYLEKDEPMRYISMLQQAMRKARGDINETIKLARKIAEFSIDVNPGKAIDVWKRILKQDPANQEAKEELKELYHKTEKWNALVELYKKEERSLPKDNIEARVNTLIKMAQIIEDKMQVDAMVVNVYNSVLKLDPENEQAIEALSEKYKKMGRWKEVITIYQKKTDSTKDLDTKKEYLKQIAHYWSEKLSNPNRAAQPLEEILEFDPGDIEVINSLKDIYEQRRNWKGLFFLRQKELELIPESEKHKKLVELAEFAQNPLNNIKLAIETWNRILESDPYDIDAMENLIFLYRRDKRYAALVEMLNRKISMSTDEEALPLLEKTGNILTDKMKSYGAKAMEIWERVHELNPNHPKSLKILKTLYAENKNWDQLESLFSQNDNWLGYIETLSQYASREEDPEAKIFLLFKVADIYRTKIGKPERAIKPYEKVLQTDETNKTAAENLLPLYEELNRWNKAADMYEVLLKNAENKEEKLQWLHKLIESYDEKLSDPAQAFKWCGEAYLISPLDNQIIAQLESFAEQSDKWIDLAEIYNQVKPEMEGDNLIDLLSRLSKIYIEKLSELEKGESVLQEILAIDKESHKALEGLASIYEIKEEWDELTAILNKQIELDSEPQKTIWAREKMASIMEIQKDDKESAIRYYNEIIDIDPTHLKSLQALDRLYLGENEFKELARILKMEIKEVEEEERIINLEFRLGELLKDMLEQPAEALPHFARVLEFSPQHEETIAAIREILENQKDNTTGIEAAGYLLPYYKQEELWEDYTFALEAIASQEEDELKKIEFYQELLDITTQKIGDMGKGFELAIQLFKLKPEDEEVRKKLHTLAKLDERIETLKETYLEYIENHEDKLKLSLSWEIARMEEIDEDNREEAQKFYLTVLEEDPLHEGAFLALERIFSGSEDWEDLKTLYTKRLDVVADPEEQKDILTKLSHLNENMLADVEAAINSYTKLRELDNESDEAFEALIRLYELSDKWENLAALYEDELIYADSDQERIDLMYKRADILLHKMESPNLAIDILREILEFDQEHENTRQMLEEMLELKETRQKATDILVRLNEDENNHEKLVDLLEIKLEDTQDNYEAVDILSKIGQILTLKLSEPEKAFEVWRRAIKFDPASANVRDSIENLAIALNSYEKLVEVWQEAIEAIEDNNLLIIEYLEKIADIYETHLENSEKAIEWYKKLLSKASEESMLQKQDEAAQALINLYQSMEEWIEIIEIYKKQLNWTQGEKERKEIYRNIAVLQEDMLDAPLEAAQTYQKLLEEFPTDEEALDRLEFIYSRIEKWDELVKILAKKVELTQDEEQRLNYFSRIAILREESLNDIEGAIEAWTSILNENPEHGEAIRYLARLNEQQGNWIDVFDYVERELNLTEDDDDRRSLNYRLGYILQVHLEEPERAIFYYRNVLDEDPTHEKSKAALESMLQGEETLALQAAEILETIYELENDWEKLTRLYVLKAGYAFDPHQKVSLFLKIAGIKETELGEPVAAFGFYGQALKEAVGEPELPDILAQLQRIAALEDKWQQLVDLYVQVADDIIDINLQQQVFLTIADVARDELEELDIAQKYYEKVLEISPENFHSMDALERVYELTEQWDLLMGIYTKRANMALDNLDARYDALVKAAELCREKLDEPNRAIEHYNTILEFKPDDYKIFRALEEILFDLEKWDNLIELYENRIRYTAELEEAVEIRFNMGEIFCDYLENQDRALESFRAALGGDPTADETINRLESFLDKEDFAGEASEVLIPVYAARQDWKKLIKVLSIQRDIKQTPEEKAQLTSRIAELYETVLDDLEEAYTWYGYLLLEQPDNQKVRDRLLNLSELLDKWEVLTDVFSKIVEDAFYAGEHITIIMTHLARIYAREMNKIDESMKYYKRILENDSSNQDIFRELELLLIENERWDDLLKVYRDAADSFYDPEKKNQNLYKISELLEDKMDKLEDAVEVYREILESSPEEQKAVEALTKLYTKLGNWEELIEHLIQQVSMKTEPSEIIELNLKLAELYYEKVDDPDSAVFRLEEIINIDPLNENTIDYLEKLLDDDNIKLRVAKILEPIYKELDYWKQLVSVYEIQIELSEDEYRKIELLKECAHLYDERGDDLALAFKSLSEAWKLEPSNREILNKIYEISVREGNWEELIAVLQEGIKDNYDTELQIDVLLKIARIQAETLDDREQAIITYYKLLDIRDDHLQAISELSQLLQESEQWKKLSALLAKKSELLTDQEEILSTLRQLARLRQDVLSEPEEAISTWDKLLMYSPEDTEALSALETLYQETEKYIELSEILKTIIRLDEENKIDKAFKLAEIQQEKLNDSFEAITALKIITEDSPDNIKALEMLSDLYKQDENWYELIKILEQRTGLETDNDKRNNLILETGNILRDKINDIEKAVEKYKFILDFNPDHEQAVEALEQLLDAVEYRNLVAEILEPLYQTKGQNKSLINLYKLLLEDQADPEKRKVNLKSIAELYLTIQEPMESFKYWGILFKENPENKDAETQLHTIASEHQAWDKLVELYSEIVEEIYDEEIRKEILLTQAKIYELSLEDLEGAVRVMQKAVEFMPDNMEILNQLDRLLNQTSKFEELENILQMEANTAFEPDEKSTYFYRLGQLRLEHFENHEGALAAWRDALTFSENHELTITALEKLLEKDTAVLSEILDLLQPIYENLGYQEKMVGLLKKRIEITDDPIIKSEYIVQAANISQQLGNIEEAFGFWGKAVKNTPEEKQYVDEFIKIAEISNKEADLIQIISDILDSKIDEMTAIDLAMRTAQIALNSGDNESVEKLYRFVLNIEPENMKALENLEEFYRITDEVNKLIEILDKRSEVIFDFEKKETVLKEIANLSEQRLENPQKAIAAWQKLFDQNEAKKEVQDQLIRLYEKTENWQKLIEILKVKANYMGSDPGLLEIKHKTAQLLADKLEKYQEAEEIWQDTFLMYPSDEVSYEALCTIYKNKEDWDALKDIYFTKLSQTQEETDKVPILENMASLVLNKQEDLFEAGDYYKQIIDIDPSNEKAFNKLDEIFIKTERYHDLIQILEKRKDLANSLENSEEEVYYLDRIARIWEENLGSPDNAIQILGEILERDSGNVTALTGMARLYENMEDLEKCQQYLEKAALLEPKGREGAELAFRRGNIALKLGEKETAITRWEEALELYPDHSEAFSALQKHYEETENKEGLLRLYEIKLPKVEDPEERLPLLLSISQLFVELGASEAAFPYLEEAAKIEPENIEVKQKLGDTYYASGNHDKAMEIYTELIDKLKSNRKAKKSLSVIYQRIGKIKESQEDFAGALEMYNQSRRLNPTNIDNMLSIAGLHERNDELEKAQKIYRAMLFQKLDGIITKSEIYFKIAKIDHSLGNTKKAISSAKRGLSEDPNNQKIKDFLEDIS